MFTAYKQANGRYRWVAMSGNAYRDRDSEIVSVKSLVNDVKRADKDGDYGPLRFWHMKGVDLGTTDFNMVHGKTLLESGELYPEVAEKIAKTQNRYQMSIGFRHPIDEPDQDGVYHNIIRFERSLVPEGRAANPFTSFSVMTKEKDSMDEKQKIEALKELLGESLASQKLQEAQEAEKSADSMGVAFKSDDMRGYLMEVIEYGLALKEAELEMDEDYDDYEFKAKKADDKEMIDEDESPAISQKAMDGYMTEMKGMMNKMGGYMEKMDGYFGKMNKPKEDPEKTKEFAESISGQLAEMQKSIDEVIGQRGYRPTQAATSVVATAQKSVNGSGQSGFDSFLDFLTKGV